MGVFREDVQAQRSQARATIRGWTGNSNPDIVDLFMEILRRDLDGVELGSGFFLKLENALLAGDRVTAHIMVNKIPDDQYRPWAAAAVFGWRLTAAVAAVVVALIVGTWLAVGCVEARACAMRARTAVEAERCVAKPGAKSWP